MTKPWFDADTGRLLFDHYVMEMPSFQACIADGVVTAEEVATQSVKVSELLRALEAALPPDTRELATDALCELAVLQLLHSRLKQ